MTDAQDSINTEERKQEINAHFHRAEMRLVVIFMAMLMFSAFFQWVAAQLPDLSSEALEVVCRVLYQ